MSCSKTMGIFMLLKQPQLLEEGFFREILKPAGVSALCSGPVGRMGLRSGQGSVHAGQVCPHQNLENPFFLDLA